jgi:hypothetical protein
LFPLFGNSLPNFSSNEELDRTSGDAEFAKLEPRNLELFLGRTPLTKKQEEKNREQSLRFEG